MGKFHRLLFGQVIPAVLSGVILALAIYNIATGATEEWLHTLDTAVALILLVEWVFKFANSSQKSKYFRKNWWLLIAAIPISNEITETLRGLRLLPFLLVLRTGIKLTSIDMSASRNLKRNR